MYSQIPATSELMKIVEQNEAGCWIWKGKFNGTYGYGCYKIDNRLVTAHRVMYMSIFGRLERKQFVCHKCDVPACVNPMHMFIGSQKENMQDCRRKNRHFRGALTHCKFGHEFTPENTYIHVDKYGDSHRKCLACASTRWQRLSPEQKKRHMDRTILARKKKRAAMQSASPTPPDSNANQG